MASQSVAERVDDIFQGSTDYFAKSLEIKILPKKIAQIKTPNSNPQKIPSSQPLTGITCQAIKIAIAILVTAMIFMPPRMESQGLL